MTSAIEKYNFSDLSGHFYVDLKREDVSEFTGLTSLFYDAHKEFDRIDVDRNGVLSKAEINAELKNDLKKQKRFKVLNLISSVASIGLTFLTRGRVRAAWGLISGLNLVSAYRNSVKQEKVEEKLSTQF